MSPALTGAAAALGAALLWTVATRLFQGAGSRLGALELNLAKAFCALPLFLLALPASLPGHRPLTGADTLWLAASGLLGLGLGDSAYFKALAVLGTRRALLLELLAAPTAFLLGAAALGEGISPVAAAGLGLVLAGVGLAIWSSQPAESGGPDRQARRRALAWGVLAALCQGGGLVLARAAFREPGLDAALAAVLRLSAGALALALVLRGRVVRLLRDLRAQRTVLLRVGLAASLGTWLGIWLQQVAVQRLSAGIAQTLLATAPLFALVLARAGGRSVGAAAWLGTLLSLAGVALLGAAL